MKFAPKSETELSSFNLIPDGVFPFTVLASDEIASKSEKNKGKMMFALKLNVHGPDGDRHTYDYFSFWLSEWKLRHFAATTGKLADYESGSLDGSLGAFNGLTGYAKIGSEEPVSKSKYPAKNVVVDYVVKKKATESAPENNPHDLPDDVPFN